MFRSLLFLLPAVAAPALEPLRYNHPWLAVDLGVGLWAWPVPCDADGAFYAGFCRSLILYGADSIQCHARGWDRERPAVFVSNKK